MPAASNIPQCEKPGGMGLARIVEIDTIGGPGFGFQHFKQYDFLHDKEVVLTFDDGPWPSTPAVLEALTDECLKATFFEIGKHATWHPEITKRVIDAGMTVGTHTWSHKDLARNPYAKHLEEAEQEVEMGNSAVHMAAARAKRDKTVETNPAVDGLALRKDWDEIDLNHLVLAKTEGPGAKLVRGHTDRASWRRFQTALARLCHLAACHTAAG